MHDFFVDDKTTKKGMKVLAAGVRTEVTLGKKGAVMGPRVAGSVIILDLGGAYRNNHEATRLLYAVFYVCAKLLQLCPTLRNPVDCSPPGSSVHGILQARILKWIVIPFSRGSSQPRDRTCVPYVSCIDRWVLYH